MNGEKPREIAIKVLRRRTASGEYVEKLLETELAKTSLTGPDRALCQELVYGMMRWQATLDWLVSRKTANRTQNTTLRLLLHLGLYQLFWLERIPNHAAVHETVELGKALGFGPQSGFVNAVLRGYTRERDATLEELKKLKQNDPATGYSHPRWLVERWEERWGREKVIQLLEWNNSPPPVFARLNTLKSDYNALTGLWRDENVDYVYRQWNWTGENLMSELKSHPPLAQLESFKQGTFYVQDPSTILAVKELEPGPGDTILDLCAAPGGKTTYIAQLMLNQGRITATDAQPDRLRLVKENCERLGVTCVEFPDSIEGKTFDKILVDAPCSNTGVLRRRVDLRWRLKPEEISRLSQSQAALLEKAAAHLKPGGLLLYSTCSLEPEENEKVVDDFVRKNSPLKLERQRKLVPFNDGVDGAFVARLRKSG